MGDNPDLMREEAANAKARGGKGGGAIVNNKGHWKPDVVSMAKVKEAEALTEFRNYVTQIGFCLMLSKRQIEALAIIRDFGQVQEIYSKNDPRHKEAQKTLVSRYSQSNTVTISRSLQRRGLVLWWPAISEEGQWIENAMIGHRSFTLTKQGELVCELLTLAGIIAPKHVVSSVPRKRAKP